MRFGEDALSYNINPNFRLLGIQAELFYKHSITLNKYSPVIV